MSGDGTQLIFSELLERHDRIQVPLIQRDYAQGRIDQVEVREEFLAALHEALCLPRDSEALPLNLDFIYGSVEGKTQSCFEPLDGQQRITTLFLLHWYLAWCDGCDDAFRTLCTDGATSRLSYQVRQSSSEFFDALVAFTPSCGPEEVSSLRTLLVDQPWYFRSWRLDPTIQSALVMLDNIHARFSSEKGLYVRLTDVGKPAITFHYLDLKNFGLSDDLYIKMNARGKALTPFETFKARYEQTLDKLFPTEKRLLERQPVTVAEFFAQRMDTRWSDFFWPYRDQKSHVFDSAVMNFFRVVILITRAPQGARFVEDITHLRSGTRKNSYAFFEQRGWLDISFSEMLITLLETWSAADDGLARQLPDGHYFDEEKVLSKILSSTTELSYEEIVQLSAYVQFLRMHVDTIDPAVFQEWMRVAFNLSVNTEYNRATDLQRSLTALEELAPQMDTILEHLAKDEVDISGFNQEQVAEEQLKAHLLRADDGWRPLIDEAEAHGYFRGQIGFLLRFAGVSTHPPAESERDSKASETRDRQSAFSDFLQKASAMFDRDGLKELPEYRWERALLVFGDYLLMDGRNHSFLVNQRTHRASWKRLLRYAASGSYQGQLVRMLWEKLSGTADLAEQLDAVIQEAKINVVIGAASGMQIWRYTFIRTPAAIAYCQERMIRRSTVIYLLSKSRMSGAHAELFTYSLYADQLKPAYTEDRLQVLVPSYRETNTWDEEPGVRLSAKYHDQYVSFFLQYHDNQYLITLVFQESLSDALSAVLRELAFTQSNKRVTRGCSMGDIEALIFSLDKRLAETA